MIQPVSLRYQVRPSSVVDAAAASGQQPVRMTRNVERQSSKAIWMSIPTIDRGASSRMTPGDMLDASERLASAVKVWATDAPPAA